MSESNTTAITPVNADEAVNAVRYAVKARGTWVKYVTDNKVTRETVKDHAAALAALAYPSDKPIQRVDGTRTRYGNAVQAAGNGMRAALDKEESDGEPTVQALLTKAGFAATLEEVTAAWKSAQV